MNRLLIALISLLFLIPSQIQAKTGVIFATALTAGTGGSLDAVECGDIIGDNTNRPIADGDVALVVSSGKLFYVYRYNASGTDALNSPSIIVPNDRSLCSNVGQWELVEVLTSQITLGDFSNLVQINLNISPADLTWSGTVITITAGEALTAGELLYSKNASGGEKFYLYDANGTDKYEPPRAIAIADIASGDTGLAGIGTGIFRKDAWAMTSNQDEGAKVWASVTPGAITLTAPSTSEDQLALVGYVKEENVVQFNLGNVVCFEVP